jgi:hypothetical protein
MVFFINALDRLPEAYHSLGFNSLQVLATPTKRADARARPLDYQLELKIQEDLRLLQGH